MRFNWSSAARARIPPAVVGIDLRTHEREESARNTVGIEIRLDIIERIIGNRVI